MVQPVKDSAGRFGMFSIFDAKALFFAVPFVSTNNGTACRSFSELVNNKDSDCYKHPDDYILYRIGSWDDSHGIVLAEPPVNLGVAISFKEVSHV